MADTATANTPFNASLGQGEDHDAYLNRLLTSGQYSNPQDAVDQFNTSVYGGKVNGPSDAGYGKSPAYYPTNNGGGQQAIGMPGYYLVKQADGSWQKTMRSAAAPKPNLPAPTALFQDSSQNPTSAINTSGAGTGLALGSLGLGTPQAGQAVSADPSQLQAAQQAAINQRLTQSNS